MLLYRLSLVLFQALATITGSYALETSNKKTVINLRVEGKTHTIFEGPIVTRGHNVTTQSGGTHHCDGTNNGQNKFPGPTATSALDDASHKDRFTWDGTFFEEFDDYLVSRIGRDVQTDTQFWLLVVNFKLAQVGGCQQNVTRADEVLWAFGTFDGNFLKLTGPKTAHKGHPITVVVTDGATGKPVVGATVGGEHMSGRDGKVSLTFTKSGRQLLKAEHPQSIRSNALELDVV